MNLQRTASTEAGKTGWKAFVVAGLLLTPGILLAQATTLPDFTALVEKNAPAIVNVSTVFEVDKSNLQKRAQLRELLRELYGERGQQLQIPDQDDEGDDEDSAAEGATGSGFIIDGSGYIVTNNHVVDHAKTVKVTLNDQREFEARIIGTDDQSDLALLKIDAGKLPTVKLGDSQKLKVGEWVLAIGSPFGLEYSVTAGIVSYIGRNLPTGTKSRMSSRSYVSYIQTDVAINPGHSGGPLINMAGEVVGINSQIFTNSGGSIGLSFAIPVDVAKNVVAQLRESGKVQRGWLGVAIGNVDQEKADAFHLDRPHGALISDVVMGGPAEAAGVTKDDVIVKFNTHEIRTRDDLPYFVGLLKPGTEASLDVIRAGKLKTLKVKVGNLEDAAKPLALSPAAPDESGRLGLVVTPLDARTKKDNKIDGGVLVQKASGVAKAARLQAGDIIVSIGGQTLNTPQDLARLESILPPNRPLPVLVVRDGQQSFFTLRIEP